MFAEVNVMFVRIFTEVIIIFVQNFNGANVIEIEKNLEIIAKISCQPGITPKTDLRDNFLFLH